MNAKAVYNLKASDLVVGGGSGSQPSKPCRKQTATAEVTNPSSITPDTPLRLDVAVKLAFPAGGMTVSGLRRETARGRLQIETVAGKQFVTLRAIEEMRNRCREQQKAQDYGSNPSSETAKVASSGGQRGSFATDHVRSARAALEKTAQGLSERSPSTSTANTKLPASGTVIPLKSSS
jgi:hypothetical protein